MFLGRWDLGLPTTVHKRMGKPREVLVALDLALVPLHPVPITAWSKRCFACPFIVFAWELHDPSADDGWCSALLQHKAGISLHRI